MTDLPELRPFPSVCEGRPRLFVVVDTEEEFDWEAPFDARNVAVENIQHQALAQAIMDGYGIVPTYVIDYAVASSPAAAGVLRSFSESGRCEIGAHLHPWVTPPYQSYTDEFHSYPGNLLPALERQKLDHLTIKIEEAFGHRPTIYKAGRYGIGPSTFRILADLGYMADLSVVSRTSFSSRSGPDFTKMPPGPSEGPYGIIELPLSVHYAGVLSPAGPLLQRLGDKVNSRHVPIIGALSRLGLLSRLRLTPEGHSLRDMVRLTRTALKRGERYFMLSYHSSSLLPGGNPYVRNASDRAEFLFRLGRYFEFFISGCGGRSERITSVVRSLSPAKMEPALAH